eukprot:SAG11_NODE_241_length_11781_cov_8.401900_7_plen_378_part_00
MNELEFKMLIGFMVYYNTFRHIVQELQTQFGERLNEDEFYLGCSILGETMADEDAKDHFERIASHSGNDGFVTLNQFLSFMAHRHGIEDDIDEDNSDDDDALIEIKNAEQIGAFLNEKTGTYGDVHFQELTSVLGSDRRGKHRSQHTGALLRFHNLSETAAERMRMVKDALRFTTVTNDSFPRFEEDSLLKFVRQMIKQDYFVGQHIITQGEIGDCYYVLRRGRCSVYVDQKHVANLEWGMGFGEVALVLETRRTATIIAATPCEVFRLSREDYQKALNTLPPKAKISHLGEIVEKFWQLVCNENKGRQSVDFFMYLQLHLRIAKVLTSEDGDFDEDDERETTREDWVEDCDRYGLGVSCSLEKEVFINALYQLVVS